MRKIFTKKKLDEPGHGQIMKQGSGLNSVGGLLRLQGVKVKGQMRIAMSECSMG